VFENLTQQLGIPDSTRSASGQGSDAGDNWATYRSLLQALAQTSPLMTEEENRLFVAKQVLDPASHLNRLSDWTNLQTQSVKDDRLRLALRRFMRLPVQAWALHQLRISTRNLNGLWASDTVPRLKSVTTRFPFSPAGVDASPDEIAEFLHQGNGALSQFRQRYLQAGHNTLSLQDKDRLLVPLRLDPDFNALMSRLQLLRHADITTDKLSAFELTAQPNPALTEQTFSMDAQTLRYRNGPQIPQVFLWQGQSPSLTIHINGQTQHGQVCQAMTFSGRMAWIRALQAAHVTRRGADWLLHWTPCADKTSQVSFLYRHLSGLNPSDISLLERWPIPLAIFKDTPE
jgi:type VI protein secretion system component VasK